MSDRGDQDQYFLDVLERLGKNRSPSDKKPSGFCTTKKSENQRLRSVEWPESSEESVQDFRNRGLQQRETVSPQTWQSPPLLPPAGKSKSSDLGEVEWSQADAASAASDAENNAGQLAAVMQKWRNTDHHPRVKHSPQQRPPSPLISPPRKSPPPQYNLSNKLPMGDTLESGHMPVSRHTSDRIRGMSPNIFTASSESGREDETVIGVSEHHTSIGRGNSGHRQVDELLRQLDMTEGRCDKLVGELRVMCREKNDAVLTESRAQIQIRDLEKQLEVEAAKVKRLAVEMDQCQSNYHLASSKLRRMEEQLNQSDDAKGALERSLSCCRGEMSKLEAKFETLATSYRELQKQYEIGNRDTRNLDSKLRNSLECCDAAKRSEESSRQVIDELRYTEKQLKTEIRGLQERILLHEEASYEKRHLKTQLEATRKEVGELKEELSSVQNENRLIKSREEKLVRDLQDMQNAQLSLRQDNFTLRKRISVMGTDFEMHSTGVSGALRNTNYSSPIPTNSSTLLAETGKGVAWDSNGVINNHASMLASSCFPMGQGHGGLPEGYTSSLTTKKINTEQYGGDTTSQRIGVGDKLFTAKSADDCSAPAHTNGTFSINRQFDAPPQKCQSTEIQMFESSTADREVLPADPMSDSKMTQQWAGNLAALNSNNFNSLEKQLLLLNLEKTKIESELTRFPSSSYGRTIKELEAKRHLELRLSGVENSLHKVRGEMVQHHKGLQRR